MSPNNSFFHSSSQLQVSINLFIKFDSTKLLTIWTGLLILSSWGATEIGGNRETEALAQVKY